jgi:hypothetical protein
MVDIVGLFLFVEKILNCVNFSSELIQIHHIHYIHQLKGYFYGFA